MVFLVLLMMLWVGVCRQLAGHLRIEKACQLQREDFAGCRRAMAWALTLAETGKPPAHPPEDTVAYRMIIDDETYVAIFTRMSTFKYHVTVRPLMYLSDESYPLAPDTF